MPNPVFIIVFIFIICFSIISLSDYFRGLKVFFVYLMVAGFLKRFMNLFGTPSGLEYSVFVGFSLILLSSVIVGFILRKQTSEKTTVLKKQPVIWYLYVVMLVLLFVGIFRSPLPLIASFVTFLVPYYWMLAFPIGFGLKKDQVIQVIRLFVITAIPILLYGLFQFFHGPFQFEISSVDRFSAVSDWETGSFRRGTPTYDSFEPQAVHLVTAFLFAGWRPLRLPKYVAPVVRILVLVALVVSGNRGGLLLLASALVLYLAYRLKVSRWRLRSSLVIGLLTVFFVALNFLYVPFQDILEETEPVFASGSGTDFQERLGAIYTISARLDGRLSAMENLSLLGVGTGYNYATGTIRNKPGFSKAESYLPGSTVGAGAWSHDLLGELIIEQGIVGLAVFLALCFTYVRRTTSVVPSDHVDAKLLAGLSAIFLSAIATAAVLGGSYFWNRQGAFLWMMAGFSLSPVAIPSLRKLKDTIQRGIPQEKSL
jgi:hypothetical protein